MTHVTRNVLVVSPYFPPSTLAGVHRARHLVKHLPSFGWKPVLLCVDEAFHEQRLDPGLAKLTPPSLELVKVSAVPIAAARLFGIGDIGLRALPSLALAVARLLRSRPISAILISGSPFYPMLMSSWIKRRYHAPIVLDFQDPWVSRWGAQQTGGKAALAHRLARLLEPCALRGCDFITSVSHIQNEEMAGRYPWLDASRMAAIPIGGDREDFDSTRARTGEAGEVRLDPTRINLTYVGTFLPRAEPLARCLFEALAMLRAREPELAARLRLNFVGTSNQPNDRISSRVTPIALEAGVGDLVAETPQRVPYLEALTLLAQSNGLLLIGSDEPHYTASKIYPALMSGRPYLSLFHAMSSAHAILAGAGGGLSFAFSTAQELAALRPALADGLRALALSPERFGRADPAIYAPYEAGAVAGRYAGIFDRLANRPG